MGGISVFKSGKGFSRLWSPLWECKWRMRVAILALVFGALTVFLLGELEFSRALNRSVRARGNVQRGVVPSVSRPALDSLRATLRHCIKVIGSSSLIYPIVNKASIKRVLSSLPGTRALYGSKWDRRHPFDRAYGTDTSGFLYGDDILTGHPAEEHGSPYAGVQPSVLRAVLATLPNIKGSTFIDLGCGKGRPMLIASEFPFRDIIGVELSPALVRTAQKNAATMAARHPDRTRIRVEMGDATVFPIPSGDVVLFVYNSFDRDLMLKVVENVEKALLSDGNRSIFVAYCNPASGDCFDCSRLLVRRFARTLPYAPEEIDYAEDREDAVIVWQGGSAPEPVEPADARIVVTKERWRAELHPNPGTPA